MDCRPELVGCKQELVGCKMGHYKQELQEHYRLVGWSMQEDCKPEQRVQCKRVQRKLASSFCNPWASWVSFASWVSWPSYKACASLSCVDDRKIVCYSCTWA